MAMILKNLGSVLVSGIDYFIGDSFKTDMHMRYKARLLAGCICSFMVAVLFFGLFYSNIDSLTREAYHYYYLFACPLMVYWVWVLRMMRLPEKYPFLAHSMIVTTVLVLFGGILVTGGPAKTEMLPLVIIPVILAFMMLGHRSGLVWALLIAAIQYVLLMLDYIGFEFINVAPEQALGALRIFNWSYAFVAMVILVMIYESMTRRLISERHLEREHFHHMAMHDVLTGLPNRKYFDELLDSALALADRSGSTMAIGLLDLNGFKPINDEAGHEAGDIVLQTISRRIQQVLRKSDKVARLGDDEFALILTNLKAPEDIASVVDKLLSAIARPIEVNDDGLRLSISASLGIALFPDDTRDESELRVFSDKAMYHAKRSGSEWCLYSDIAKGNGSG